VLPSQHSSEPEIPEEPLVDAAPLSGIQREALELLEWGRLGEHVAGFASTTAGRRVCRALPLAPSLEASRQLLAQTTELLALDGVLEGGLSFQGVAELSRTVQLCAKGGVASADELLDVATTLAAARWRSFAPCRSWSSACASASKTGVAWRIGPARPWPSCAARSAPLARSAAIG
jgi:DNA mismatch repair protein MutS2